jgi:hypothetical protein
LAKFMFFILFTIHIWDFGCLFMEFLITAFTPVTVV